MPIGHQFKITNLGSANVIFNPTAKASAVAWDILYSSSNSVTLEAGKWESAFFQVNDDYTVTMIGVDKIN
jgi:hypothetical protein